MKLSPSDLEVRRWAANLIDDEDWGVDVVCAMDPELLVERLCSKLAETQAKHAELVELMRSVPGFAPAAAETAPNLFDAAATVFDRPAANALDTTFRRFVVEALNGSSAVAFDWNLQTGEMRFTQPGSSVPWADSSLTRGSFADFCDAVHSDDRERLLDELSAVLRTGKPMRSEFRVLTPDGGSAWATFEAKSLEASDSSNPFLVGIVVDTSRFIDRAGRQSEIDNWFHDVFENAPAVMAIFDRDTPAILAVNRAAREFYGYGECDLAGISLENLFTPEEWPQFVTSLASLRENDSTLPYRGLWKHRKKDGSRFLAEIRSSAVSFQGRSARLVVVNEVVDPARPASLNEGEPDLGERQKLESLGVLAGGVAHDFNNLLTGILGNADLALNEEVNPRVGEHLRLICNAARQAAELTRQLLAYAGRGRFTIQTISLSSLIDEMIALLTVSISKKVRLIRAFEPGLPAVNGDAAQLRQVVMNLVLNASEAHGDGSGTIAVRTGAEYCSRDLLDRMRPDETLPEQLYVWFEVSDTGCGMDEAAIARMFDPFYTTKFTGRGLGLAAVQGIVRAHRGAITVASKPHSGATIRVYLPASTTQTVCPNGGSNSSTPTQGSGTVLVVDDEPMVLELASSMLKRSGFEVVAATNGFEAIQKYKAMADSISAVLLDITMPQMDGHETLRELRKINATLPVLLSSGYSEHEENLRQSAASHTGFVAKPYRSDQLLAALASILVGKTAR